MLVFGCGTTPRDLQSVVLSETEALELAVALANNACMKRFGETPFEASSYPISLREGRWIWGTLDLRGINGFSVTVSFDERGRDREVIVFFSYDQLEPLNHTDEE